jgi:hypothetical protein
MVSTIFSVVISQSINNEILSKYKNTLTTASNSLSAKRSFSCCTAASNASLSFGSLIPAKVQLTACIARHDMCSSGSGRSLHSRKKFHIPRYNFFGHHFRTLHFIGFRCLRKEASSSGADNVCKTSIFYTIRSNENNRNM